MVLYIVSLIVLSVVLVPMIRNWQQRKRDYQALKSEVHKTLGKYSFLVDKNLRVKETNFYELNEMKQDCQPSVLGNVLHCRTACDSGL